MTTYNGRYGVAQGTVLATADCECCGTRVQIKANKNGGAYYYCGGADEQGTSCCHSQRWGQRVSFALRKSFRERGEAPVRVRLPLRIAQDAPPAAAPPPDLPPDPPPEVPAPANDNTKPARSASVRPAERMGGLF